jgi:hypothetical protein
MAKRVRRSIAERESYWRHQFYDAKKQFGVATSAEKPTILASRRGRA